MTLNCLIDVIRFEDLAQQLHVHAEAIGMLAERRVEQEEGVLGERLRGGNLEVGPNAGVEVNGAVVPLPAADRLDLAARRCEGEADIARRERRPFQLLTKLTCPARSERVAPSGSNVACEPSALL